MQFLVKHYMLVVAAGIAALFLSRWDSWLEPRASRAVQWAEERNLSGPGFVFLGLFYIAFYLGRPSFYAYYHGGSLGDCYNYMRQAMINPGYVYPHHFFFAYVPMTLLRLATFLGLFHKADPFFYEKAYQFCSLPNRLMALVGLAASFALLRTMRLPAMVCVLGTFFLAVSFGYWFWTRQCNAMGALLPLMVCALYTAAYSLERRQTRFFIMAGVAACLCIFTHISSLYFVMSVVVVMTWACLRRSRLKNDSKTPMVHLTAFWLTCAGMGILFYILSGVVFRTFTPSGIMREMAYDSLFGGFQLDRQFLQHVLKDPVSVPLTVTLGLLQTGDKTLLERVMITTELTCLLWVLFSFRRISLKAILSNDRNSPIWFAGVGFFFCAVGYALRTTWLQYYVPIAPLTIFLFLGLAFHPRKNGLSNANIVPVVGLILCMLFINGISSTSVLFGDHLTDLNVYRTITVIHDVVGTKDVVYYGDKGQDWYNFNCVFGYYRFSPRFSHILWKRPIPWSQIAIQNRSSQKLLLLSAENYPHAEAAKNSGWMVKWHAVEDARTPSFYILTKPEMAH